jgi:hypothetical protein
MVGTGTPARAIGLTALLAALATVAVLAIGAGAARAAGSTAEFDWSMPARTGLDENGDGVIDVRDSPPEIDPDEWPVHFDACDSTGSIILYRWYIDRGFVAEGSPCGGFTYRFEEEGVYEVTLEVVDTDGDSAYVIKDVPVQDWLVVALGDSLGSGQGNPDIPIPGPDFDDARQAQAAYNDRVQELLDAEDAYDDTADKVNAARQRYIELIQALDHEADVCNPFSPNFSVDGCIAASAAVVDATALLTAALVDVGLEALMDSLDLIQESLDELLAAADAAVTLAEQAVDDAFDTMQNAEAALSPVWQNRRCNRSATSGQAQAALELEEADPRTSVTLVHLSCSGATMLAGLLGGYAGVEPPPGAADLPPQVDRAEDLIGGREVDAVLLSIGVNDAGFGPIVEACVFQDPCHDPPTQIQAAVQFQVETMCLVLSVFDDDCLDYFFSLERVTSAAEVFGPRIAALPDRYADLADRLADSFPAVAAEPDRVFITEYPNVLQDDDGTLCSSGLDPFDMLPGISGAESEWLHDVVTPGLNARVATAAATHHWTFVGGMFDAFAGHGYCADDSWVRRLPDSFVMQGTKEGTIHPTEDGHDEYRDGIFASLAADLYPTGSPGDLGVPPRSPNFEYSQGRDVTPPSVVGVPDREPNASGWYSADVTIDWQATDPAPSSGAPTDPPDTIASTEASDVLYTSGQSCDPEGNCATGSLTLSIDKTAPQVTCESPAPVFLLGEAGATVSATVSDGLSGPVESGVTVAADTGSVGAKAALLSGQDTAGNETSVSCGYTVTYVFGGFGPPVDAGGVMNVVKAGKAIPLKWRITDASGAPVTNLTGATISVQSLSCSLGATTDLVEETTAGGSGLQNLGDGNYQLNWKSPSSYARSCKTLRLDLGEGIVHTALFQFTK